MSCVFCNSVLCHSMCFLSSFVLCWSVVVFMSSLHLYYVCSLVGVVHILICLCVVFKALICLLGSLCRCCLVVRSQFRSHWFHVVWSWCLAGWQGVWHCGNYIWRGVFCFHNCLRAHCRSQLPCRSCWELCQETCWSYRQESFLLRQCRCRCLRWRGRRGPGECWQCRSWPG